MRRGRPCPERREINDSDTSEGPFAWWGLRPRLPWLPVAFVVGVADLRRVADRRLLGLRHQPRRPWLPEPCRVVHINATLPQVVHLRDRRTVAERGERQPEQLPQFDDLFHGAFTHPRVDTLSFLMVRRPP